MSFEQNEISTFAESNFTDEIIRISIDVTYTEFFERFMVRNVPCIIENNITKCWFSRNHWVIDNKPNFQYLQNKFGHVVAPVANCHENYYGSQKKCDMTISSFLCYWKEYILKGYPKEMPTLYLKDWHLKRDFPTSNYYQVPKFFASDWLNEFWTQRSDICDDYRFVYMGPKGSWTPEHIDVFSSYSWSANIVGKKRWLLYPPSKEIGDSNQQTKDQQKPLEVIQGTGEVIFVPSGWRHVVFNLEDTISINHNWVNSCNVEKWVWPALNSALDDVEAELQDCLKEGMSSWEEQCQFLLCATHGLNFAEFYSLLRSLAEPRLQFLMGLDQFSNPAFIIQVDELEKNVNNSADSSSKDAESNDGKLPLLCYNSRPLKVIKVPILDISESQTPVELILPDVEAERDSAEEVQNMMLCENGTCLGMSHALFDLWCIQRVLNSLLSHHSVPKLKFFKELSFSQSHLQFIHNLNLMIHQSEACNILEVLLYVLNNDLLLVIHRNAADLPDVILKLHFHQL